MNMANKVNYRNTITDLENNIGSIVDVDFTTELDSINKSDCRSLVEDKLEGVFILYMNSSISMAIYIHKYLWGYFHKITFPHNSQDADKIKSDERLF